MKKFISIILMLFALLFVLASCNDTNDITDTNSQITDTGSDNLSSDTDNTQPEIEKITDLPSLEKMTEYADSIDISYKANGKFTQMTITEPEYIAIIMKSVLESDLKNVGDTIPTGGDSYRLDIRDRESVFVVTECILHNGEYYKLRGNIVEALNYAMNPPNKYIANGCENSKKPTSIDITPYYKSLRLGNYIGDSVPSKRNNGHDFELGIYYELVFDYETATKVFSDLSELNERFFNNYYILVMGAHIATGMPYEIDGFYDFTYDYELEAAKISFEGKTGFDVTEACSIHTYFLKIPKHNTYVDEWTDKTTGKISWSFNPIGEYIEDYQIYNSDKKLDIKAGTSWLLTSVDEINEFGNYYSISPLINWKRDDSYMLIMYLRDPCSVCFVGFKELHTDGESVYITVEESDYNHNHDGDVCRFMVIEIDKRDALYPISKNPDVTILFELNVREFIE